MFLMFKIGVYVLKSAELLVCGILRGKTLGMLRTTSLLKNYEGWNFNSGNYLFTTDTK